MTAAVLAPFQPVGARPRWEILYDELRGLGVGDVLSYERMAELLGTEDRNVLRQPLARARREFLTVHKRGMESVRGVGYRVIRADQHVVVTLASQRRARRTLERGQQYVDNVRIEELDANQRALHDSVVRTTASLTKMVRKVQRDQDAMKKRMDQFELHLNETDARVAELENR